MSVAPKTPNFCATLVSSSSILSGIMVQIAMPMKEMPNTQRRISGVTAEVIHAPRAPANRG